MYIFKYTNINTEKTDLYIHLQNHQQICKLLLTYIGTHFEKHTCVHMHPYLHIHIYIYIYVCVSLCIHISV